MNLFHGGAFFTGQWSVFEPPTNTNSGHRMQIIPVIDIRNGLAVRAVAGDRHSYRPLVTRLIDSAEPAEILKSLQAEFQCQNCYVADLDGIERGQLNRCTLAEMIRTGVNLIVDVGVKTIDDIVHLPDLNSGKVVVASESLAQVGQLHEYLQTAGSAGMVFSIDLKRGELLAADAAWRGRTPLELAREVILAGVRELIVLDLAAVGTSGGIPTLELCRTIKHNWPEVRLISGGGVHSSACLQAACSAGLDGLLIASALHDGRLSAGDLAAYRQPSGCRH